MLSGGRKTFQVRGVLVSFGLRRRFSPKPLPLPSHPCFPFQRLSQPPQGKDIFELDKVVFPINQSGMHWVCAVLFVQEKRLQFYDSLGGDGSEYLEFLFRYVQDEHLDKKKQPLPDVREWQLIPCQEDTPRQLNGALGRWQRRCCRVKSLRRWPSRNVFLLLTPFVVFSPFLFVSGYDCGVFTCMFADFVSRDAPLTFDQSHVAECRERIALSILQGTALE